MPDRDHFYRTSLDRRFHDMKLRAEDMRSLWKDCADFMLPSRPRLFDDEPNNRGTKGNPYIVDGTAVRAVNVARSGLLTGLASPASVWFELAPQRPLLSDDKGSQLWLRRVRDILLAIFDRSNFYSALGAVFRDEVVFGTAAMMIYPDIDNVIRCEVLPIGGFYLDHDSRGIVDTLGREVTMTARQMIEEFGEDAVSHYVRSAATSQQPTRPYTVRHLITRNTDYVEGAIGPRGWRFSDVYWEKGGESGSDHGDPTWGMVFEGGNKNGILRVGGWREFPAVTPRWDRNDEEVYSARCPGIDALGDIMELQSERRAYIDGRNKLINPPLVGGPGIEQRPMSMMPGAKNIDPDMGSGGTGTRELHQQRVPLNDLQTDIQDVREAINAHFMVPMFLMLLQDARRQPPTAEEIRARERERAAILGPIQERQADELLDPAIDRVLSMLVRQSEPFWNIGEDGILPMPPSSLEQEPLRVRYVSDVAQSQKVVAIGGIERHAQFLGSLAQVQSLSGEPPTVLDTANFDEMASEHGEAVALPPTIARTESQLARLRADRLRTQQQAALRQQAPQMAKAAKDLSETKTDGNTALDAVMASAASQ